ncbi:hypothetical protein [Streptomyces sp. NPDC047097]|uniref:hypothetical protein n=1 Tax=Streptomyces sp. NPDC047097 TaxID=3155260 RepID=UPI0033E20DC4
MDVHDIPVELRLRSGLPQVSVNGPQLARRGTTARRSKSGRSPEGPTCRCFPLPSTIAILVAVGAATYPVVLATVALTSILSPTPDRRRDARATLTILMKRRPPR